tara:strand:+ start:199 stop:2187 length:1989 start_codon:yes stop_codon:yes gene_type:complete
MKEPMCQLYKALLLLTVIMLQACGGSDNEVVLSISADVNEAHFTNEILQESTSTIAIEVNFVGEGLLVGYAPDETPVGWLEYRTENVTDTSATIYIDVVNAQLYAADTYTTTLRLATSNEDLTQFSSHDIEVSLLVWELAVDTQKVKYNGTFGVENLPSQRITVASEISQWTATTDVDWLSLDITSGSGETEIEVTPDITSFTSPGLQQGNIVLTEIASGDTKLVPVELALDNIYMLAEHPSISLTSTSAISALERVITISNNSAKTIEWLASTEANWLTLTPINNTQLIITADPATAPMNASSLAQVTIAASEKSGVVSETINVNFYNSDLVVENTVLENLEINSNEMLSSPLFPKFYVAVDNQLKTYHQYTGTLESTLTVSPENTVLEQLIMHPAGDYLLAKAVETVINPEDETTSELVHRYRVNLADDIITEIVDSNVLSEPTDIVRLSGRYFVVTQVLEFADENLQVLFWDGANAFLASEIDVAAQKNTLFALDYDAASIKRYMPEVNDFGDDKISVSLTHEYRPGLLPEGKRIIDFMVSDDEQNIYAISESSEWISFDGDDFVDNGLLEASTSVVTLFLEKNSAGNPNYLRFDGSNVLGFYLATYGENQNITSTTYTQGRLPTRIKLSADAQRLFINVDASTDETLESQVEVVTILP